MKDMNSKAVENWEGLTTKGLEEFWRVMKHLSVKCEVGYTMYTPFETQKYTLKRLILLY